MVDWIVPVCVCRCVSPPRTCLMCDCASFCHVSASAGSQKLCLLTSLSRVPPYLCVHTHAHTHTHTQTHNLRPPIGPRQLPRLYVPKQQVLAGKMPTPSQFSLLSQSSHLQHPLLVFLAQADSKNNVHCQREVGGRAKAPLVVVRRTLHIQIEPAA